MAHDRSSPPALMGGQRLAGNVVWNLLGQGSPLLVGLAASRGRVASRMSISDVNRGLSTCGSEILLFFKKAHIPDGIMNEIVPSQALQLMEIKQRPLAVVTVIAKNLRADIAPLHEHLKVA